MACIPLRSSLSGILLWPSIWRWVGDATSLKVLSVLQPLGRSSMIQAFRWSVVLHWHWHAWAAIWEGPFWRRWVACGESSVLTHTRPFVTISIFKYIQKLLTKFVAHAPFLKGLRWAAMASEPFISSLSERPPPHQSSFLPTFTLESTMTLVIVLEW